MRTKFCQTIFPWYLWNVMEGNSAVADNVLPYYNKRFESQLVKEWSIISSVCCILTVRPAIEDGPEEIQAVVNTGATLLCESIGLPDPIVTWTKDGVGFPTTGLRHRMRDSGTIEFTSVRLEDAGRYVCTASNEAGTISRQMKLDVQGKVRVCLICYGYCCHIFHYLFFAIELNKGILLVCNIFPPTVPPLNLTIPLQFPHLILLFPLQFPHLILLCPLQFPNLILLCPPQFLQGWLDDSQSLSALWKGTTLCYHVMLQVLQPLVYCGRRGPAW